MAAMVKGRGPKDAKKTVGQLMRYLGRHKLALAAVAVMVFIGSGANIFGTYLLKPVINQYVLPGDVGGLLTMLLMMGVMYLAGVAATWGYNQLMAHTGQQVVAEIRADLFAHVQTLPLRYFDARTHGELMSRFTNDVDTLTNMLNNSFTMIIQSGIMVVGTITMLLVLNFRLSLIVIVFLAAMALFIRWNGRRSRRYYNEQQARLGDLNGFIEEMVSGQKVEKVFNHEPQDFEEFCRRNEDLRKAATCMAQAKESKTFAGVAMVSGNNPANTSSTCHQPSATLRRSCSQEARCSSARSSFLPWRRALPLRDAPRGWGFPCRGSSCSAASSSSPGPRPFSSLDAALRPTTKRRSFRRSTRASSCASNRSARTVLPLFSTGEPPGFLVPPKRRSRPVSGRLSASTARSSFSGAASADYLHSLFIKESSSWSI